MNSGRKAPPGLRLLLFIAPIAVFAVLAAYFVVGPMAPPPDDAETARTADQVAREFVTGEFTLVDHRGVAVSDTDFRGSWLLVFFGYTHCPDVCPTTLATVALVMDGLGDDAGRVQPLFITVDPARDTPALMGEYVAAFHPRLIGLTGSEDQVAAAAESHHAYYARVLLFEGDEVRTDDYGMDHSAIIYLMDRDGVYAAAFSPTDSVQSMVRRIRDFIKQSH